MKLALATLCDAARVREGLLHILGGGLSVIQRDRLPAPLAVTVALMLVAEADDVRENEHHIELELIQPDGVTISIGDLTVGAAGDTIPAGLDMPVNIPVTLPLGVPVSSPGRHGIRVRLDGETAADLVFLVQTEALAGATSPLGVSLQHGEEP